MVQKSRLQAQTGCFGKCGMKQEKQRLSSLRKSVKMDWQRKKPVNYYESKGKSE